MSDRGTKAPLSWRLKRTPKRGTRRARNWRPIYPGYVFPNTAWTVVEGPFQRIRRGKSKTWVTVQCGHCQREFERRLDHLVAGRTHCCIRCSVQIHKPWEHGEHVIAARQRERELVNGDYSLRADSDSELEADPEPDPEQS